MSDEPDDDDIVEAQQHLRDLEEMKNGFDKLYKALEREHKRLIKQFAKKLERCEKMLIKFGKR